MRGHPGSGLRHGGGDRLTPWESGWRTNVTVASGVNVIFALWLIVSPWVLDYTSDDPRFLQTAIGGLIAAIAAARVVGAWRHAWLSWANGLLGAAVLLLAILAADTDEATLNAALTGLAIMGLASFSAMASHDAEDPPPR